MRKQNDCKQRFTAIMKKTKKNKKQKTCAHATQTHVRSSCWDTENSSQRAKFLPGITSPICFINGLWRCVSKILPGIPTYGPGRWAWFSVAEAQRSDKAIPAATNGDDPSRVCPPHGVERVAGEGILHAVEIRDNRLSDGRHVRTVLCRSDASDICPLPGDDPSRV